MVFVDISAAGEELREFLHVSRSKQKSPVVAFTTGEVSRETMQLLVADHVLAVFPKPFEFAEIVTTIRAAVAAAEDGTLYPSVFGFLRRARRADAVD